MPELPPPPLHGRFQVESTLGSGGVGTVYRVRDLANGGEVLALKVLHRHLRGDPVVCERFRREVEIVRGLAHPAVVRAHQLFDDADGLSFSMELLEGRSLKEAVLATGPLPVAEAVRVLRRSLEGLAAAHARGVIHRDFKAHNVFLCADGEVKLLDFGFARVASAAGLTTRSLVLCTPDYAAPEVIAGKVADSRADLYAAGATLYEALTGRLPFRGATPFELLRQHLETAPPSLRALRPEVPASLEALVLRLLAKAPPDRFPDCAAALEALDTCLGAPAPFARPQGRGSVCPSCGEPAEPGWPLCPACGSSGGAAARGDWMVVLGRAGASDASARLRAVAESVGATPRRDLARARPAATRGLPRVVLKGIGEPLARLVRERCLEADLQVELRRLQEKNGDLLHRSNTPGYLFAAGLLLPYTVVGFLLVQASIEGVVPMALSIAFLLAGPLLGTALLTRSHWFLRPLARMPAMAEARPFPEALAGRYRLALRRVTDSTLQGTLRRVFERALVIHGAAQAGPPHVRMLLEEPARGALALAQRGMELAEASQASLDRLARAGEADLLADLEALRARRPGDPALAALLATKEEALAQVARLEADHLRLSQRLLSVASTLELASVHALGALAPGSTALSLGLRRLVDQAREAADVAREVAGPDGRDLARPARPRAG